MAIYVAGGKGFELATMETVEPLEKLEALPPTPRRTDLVPIRRDALVASAA